MQVLIPFVVVTLMIGCCRGDSCGDKSTSCQSGQCKVLGLAWSVENCARTCGYCNATKCLFSDWKDLHRCSVTCGVGGVSQVRHPIAVVPDGTPESDDCYKISQVDTCVKNSCPTHLDPAPVVAAVGATALAGATATLGATLGETLLSLLPEVALVFGKRSALDERDILDLFIRKLQEKQNLAKYK